MFRILPNTLLLIALLVLSACVAPAAQQAPTLQLISVDDLARMQEGPKDFTLVNVHIPYAGDLPKTDLSIPYDEIDQYLNQLPGKDAKIVLYCLGGGMSDSAGRRLLELGYQQVFDVDGGMVSWEASGRKLVER